MLNELDRTRAAVTACGGGAPWALSDADLLTALEQAWVSVQQLTAVTARLVRQAEIRGLPRSEAASSTVVWLRQRLRASPADAQRLVRLGAVLDASPALDAAVAAGAVSTEQARAIAVALADLPDDAGLETTAQAESTLIAYATQFDPTVLGRLGARILTHVDPDAADRHDEAALRRQEEWARRRRGFTLSPLGDGRVRLSGWLDTTAAATVTAALDPLCHPGHDATIDADLARTPSQRRADALVDVCARVLRGAGLPTTGHGPAQVVVTIPLAALQTAPASAPSASAPSASFPSASSPADSAAGPTTPATRSGHPANTTGGTRTRPRPTSHSAPRPPDRRPGAKPASTKPASTKPASTKPAGTGPATRDHGRGVLDNGMLISPTEARLLACDAQIIPAVLGTAGQVLDIGRARRLFTGPLRRGLILRDRGCSFPGCDRPPSWSDGHHIVPWADGGPTALANACLLCRHHHRVIHHTDWQVRLDPDGRPEFLPPPTIDPQRRPRRNAYHQRE